MLCEQPAMCISLKVKFIDVRKGTFLQQYMLILLAIYP